jgi:hypothetical protein
MENDNSLVIKSTNSPFSWRKISSVTSTSPFFHPVVVTFPLKVSSIGVIPNFSSNYSFV